MNFSGAHEQFDCYCCGKKFWSTRSALHQVLCNSLTLMPCNVGTPGALLTTVGPCCSEEVLDMLNSLPPPEQDGLRWAM